MSRYCSIIKKPGDGNHPVLMLSNCFIGGNLTGVTDSSVYTGATINPSPGSLASFVVTLDQPVRLNVLLVRGIWSGNTYLQANTTTGMVTLRTLTDQDNYKWIKIVPDANVKIRSLKFTSDKKIVITEVGAINQICTQMAWIDMGAVKEVGVIRTRHWAGGNALKTWLQTSIDGVTWDTETELNPKAMKPIYTRLSTPKRARYVGIRHDVKSGDWKKVYVWEISAYDQHGRWGRSPVAVPQSSTLRETLGVNGIWGWQTNKYSDLIFPPTGPRVYSKICSHARNYHNLLWDVKDPDNTPDYTSMADGKGTEAHWWLNWDREYQAWNDAGFDVHATIQFLNKTVDTSTNKWNNPFQAGYNYGKAFAEHFGPSPGNGLIKVMEVGNEPWDYPPAFYQTVLQGFVNGSKAGNPNLLVTSGAFQAHDPKALGNYFGNHVPSTVAPMLDIVNSHHYSFLSRPDGVRIAVHPEHPESAFNEVRNVLRWRDANMPGKPVWVTEWGWDSHGVNESCANTECVSEAAAALYGVRGLLILTRSGVERATWYFFANTATCNTLFCRSGLTGSKNVNFAKKKVFYSLQALLHHAGSTSFLGTIQEDRDAYIYVLGNNNDPTHIVAWRPVLAEDNGSVPVTFNLPTNKKPAAAWYINGESETGDVAPIPAREGDGKYSMNISTIPTLVSLESSN